MPAVEPAPAPRELAENPSLSVVPPPPAEPPAPPRALAESDGDGGGGRDDGRPMAEVARSFLRGRAQRPLSSESAGENDTLPPFVLHPNSSLRWNWDIWITVVLIYNILVIPFRIGFEEDAVGAMKYFELTLDLFFIIDIGFNFRTAFFDANNKLVTRPGLIAKEYLRFWFWIDFVASFPLDTVVLLIVDSGGSDDSSEDGTDSGSGNAVLRLPKLLRMLKMVRMLKMIRVIRLNKTFQKLQGSWGINSSVMQMIRMALLTLFLAHVFACVWYLVATSEGIDGSWAATEGFANASLLRKYVASLYWAITTITTVGYGDIVPRTTLEMAIAILSMIVGVSTFGYVVGNISTLAAQVDESNHILNKKIDQVGRYMRYRKLPKALQTQIREHFKYCWSRKMFLFDEAEILSELSSSLRMQVAMFLNESILRDVPFLKGASPDVITALVLKFRPQTFSPGDVIVRVGETGRHMYILSQGDIEVTDVNDNLVAKMHSGSYFGEIALISRRARRTATVRALSYCDLFVLTKEDFDNILLENISLLRNVERYARLRLRELNAIADGRADADGDARMPRSDSEKTLRKRASLCLDMPENPDDDDLELSDTDNVVDSDGVGVSDSQQLPDDGGKKTPLFERRLGSVDEKAGAALAPSLPPLTVHSSAASNSNALNRPHIVSARGGIGSASMPSFGASPPAHSSAGSSVVLGPTAQVSWRLRTLRTLPSLDGGGGGGTVGGGVSPSASYTASPAEVEFRRSLVAQVEAVRQEQRVLHASIAQVTLETQRLREDVMGKLDMMMSVLGGAGSVSLGGRSPRLRSRSKNPQRDRALDGDGDAASLSL